METTISDVAKALGVLKSSFAEDVADKIFAELDSYRAVPREDVLESVVKNLSRGILTLINERLPNRIESAENVLTTRQRIEQGVPIEDIIRAYRFSLTAIRINLKIVAQDMGLSFERTLQASELLWDLGEWFVSGAASEYRYQAGREQTVSMLQRVESIRSLLSGYADDYELERIAGLYRLQSQELYAVVLGHKADFSDFSTTEWKYSRKGACIVPLSVDISERCVGIVSEAPSAKLGPMAIGSWQTLQNLSKSAHDAEVVWQTAKERSTGLYDISSFGWRVMIPFNAPLNNSLLEKYIDPVKPDTASGRDLIRTLSMYLACQRNIRLAALELSIHQNTLRYRLERYEQLVGLDVGQQDNAFNLAWAIEVYERNYSNSQLGEFYNLK